MTLQDILSIYYALDRNVTLSSMPAGGWKVKIGEGIEPTHFFAEKSCDNLDQVTEWLLSRVGTLKIGIKGRILSTQELRDLINEIYKNL